MSKKEVHKVNLEELNEDERRDRDDKKNLKLEDISSVGDVELPVRVEFSRVKKTIEEVLEFEAGDVVKLDRFDGEDVDVFVGEVLVAKRSEEHTSELQSRGHLVCRLLLEKKK